MQADGTLQVNPVGFTYNVELDTFDIHGFRLSAQPQVPQRRREQPGGIVVDDVPSVDPSRVRCLEVRGDTEVVVSTGRSQDGLDDAVIRIHPERIISSGSTYPIGRSPR